MLKPILDFPGYFITDDGRVLSANTYHKRPLHWLCASCNSTGRLIVILSKNGRRYTCKVHRLVLETFVGPCPQGMEACHNNGNPLDNRVGNLRWDTRSANQKDAVRQGTCALCRIRGEDRTHAKLTAQQVRQLIYAWRTELFTQKELAMQYEITQSAVSRIVTKKVWRHLWA